MPSRTTLAAIPIVESLLSDGKPHTPQEAEKHIQSQLGSSKREALDAIWYIVCNTRVAHVTNDFKLELPNASHILPCDVV